jgi:hypothetical protein
MSMLSKHCEGRNVGKAVATTTASSGEEGGLCCTMSVVRQSLGWPHGAKGAESGVKERQIRRPFRPDIPIPRKEYCSLKTPELGPERAWLGAVTGAA